MEDVHLNDNSEGARSFFSVAKDTPPAPYYIVQQFHYLTFKGGGLLTLNASREEFWILVCGESVTTIIIQCIRCS